VTFAMMCHWVLLTRERMGEPGAHPRHRHLEGWFRHDGAVARWSGAFLRRWLAGPPGALPGRTESSNWQETARGQ
jgi:GMP synthase (glutamine-hydrolysing)